MTITPALITRLRTAWKTGTGMYRDGRECPEAEQIFEAAAARGSARQRRAIIAHTACCGACAESWRIAMAIHSETPAVNVSTRADTTRRSRFPAAWGVATAAILVLAVGIFNLHPIFERGVPAPTEPGTLRGVADLPITLNMADGAHLPAGNFRLSWQPLEDVLVYQLEVTDSELNLIFAQETTQADFLVPADRLDNLTAGSELHWYVVAVLSDGREARSQTRTVIINDNH